MAGGYTPDDQGIRAFMNSAELGRAMTGVAQDLAAQANSSGRSKYGVRSRTVQGGWRASDRAGAEVYEADRSWADVRARHLRNVTKQFRVRGVGL